MFPQLKGLGQSSSAAYFGLAGAQEAADYLRDPVLGARLIEAAAAVRSHLAGTTPLNLVVLMGSGVDTLKLVSCMTLFRHVAGELAGADAASPFAAMAEHADAILGAAAAQGYPVCRFTETAVGRKRG